MTGENILLYSTAESILDITEREIKASLDLPIFVVTEIVWVPLEPPTLARSSICWKITSVTSLSFLSVTHSMISVKVDRSVYSGDVAL